MCVKTRYFGSNLQWQATRASAHTCPTPRAHPGTLTSVQGQVQGQLSGWLYSCEGMQPPWAGSAIGAEPVAGAGTLAVWIWAELVGEPGPCGGSGPLPELGAGLVVEGDPGVGPCMSDHGLHEGRGLQQEGPELAVLQTAWRQA